MTIGNRDEARVRDYLLGQLSDEERLKIEERLLVEDDLFEEFEISKGEVVEDYCAGQLSQRERKWFERNYLASEEGRQKYTFALALSGFRRPEPQPPPPPPPVRSWGTVAALSSVVLVIAIVAIVNFLQPTRYTNFELAISSPTRGNGPKPPTIRLADADKLRISLALPPTTPPAASYRAEVTETLETKAVKITGHDSRSVSIEIPTKELHAGQYAVNLWALSTDGQEQRIAGNYFFNTE